MQRFALLIGCTSLSIIPGCMADSTAEDLDQVQVTESELTTAPGVAASVSEGYYVIRLANTQLCLQPRGRSHDDVLVELSACNASVPEQTWLIFPQSNGTRVINSQTSKCVYNNGPLPLFNGAVPIDHESCFVFGTFNQVASNALWKLTTTAGYTSFQSRVQFRDTGFCMDVPGGFAYDGVTLQNWSCNGTPAQAFILERVG